MATPGMRELLSIGKVWELAQLERRTRGAAPYDLVVVDAPATGHGVGILRTPRTFAEIARVGPIAHQGGRSRPRSPTPRSPAWSPSPRRRRCRSTRRSRCAMRSRDDGLRARRRDRQRSIPDRFGRERGRAARRRARAEPSSPLARAALRGRAVRARPRRNAARAARPARRTALAASWSSCRSCSPTTSVAASSSARRRARGRPRELRPARAPRRRPASASAPRSHARGRGASLSRERRGAARGQAGLRVRRLGRRRQDDHLGGDRARDGGPRARRSRS